MASKHSSSTLPNNPNYYWEQALISFDHGKMIDCDMYLILYAMAPLGE
jgi:hypothetical protein